MQYIHSNVPTLKRGDVVDPLFSVAYKFGYTERKKSGGVSRKSIDIMFFFPTGLYHQSQHYDIKFYS